MPANDHTTSPFVIGQKVGNRILVAGPELRQGQSQRYTSWLVRCPCGTERWVEETRLRRGIGLIGCRRCGKLGLESGEFFLGKNVGERTIVDGPIFRRRSGHDRRHWQLECRCGRRGWFPETFMRSVRFPTLCPSCVRVKDNGLFNIGDDYGLRTIVDGPHVVKDTVGRGHKKWTLECECGDRIMVSEASMRQGKAKLGCHVCAREHYQSTPHTSVYNEQLEGLRGWKRKLWASVIRGAELRGLIFGITWDEAFAVIKEQRGLCPYTGLQLVFAGETKLSKGQCMASLDRIDSSQGYIPTNIQWVDKRVNRMKGALPHDQFTRLCRLIAKRFPARKSGNGLPLC